MSRFSCTGNRTMGRAQTLEAIQSRLTSPKTEPGIPGLSGSDSTDPLSGCSISHFTVPGQPQPLPRHRTRIVKARNGKTFLSNYLPKTATIQKECVAIRAHNAGVKVSCQPVLVLVVANFELAKSHHRVRTPIPEEWHTQKPDADNVLKLVCDGLQGVAYPDDSHAACKHVEKVRAAQGVAPRCDVWVLSPFTHRTQFVALYGDVFPGSIPTSTRHEG